MKGKRVKDFFFLSCFTLIFTDFPSGYSIHFQVNFELKRSKKKGKSTSVRVKEIFFSLLHPIIHSSCMFITRYQSETNYENIY